jgi:hypothetical protein
VDYDESTGLLLVEHVYPKTCSLTPRAHVDVNLVLETTDRKLVESGAWVNVMGYVKQVSAASFLTGNVVVPGKEHRAIRQVEQGKPLPLVQAVLLWSAGTTRVEEYETTLRGFQKAHEKARAIHHAE